MGASAPYLLRLCLFAVTQITHIKRNILKLASVFRFYIVVFDRLVGEGWFQSRLRYFIIIVRCLGCSFLKVISKTVT